MKLGRIIECSTILYPCIPARVHTLVVAWPSTHKQTLWQPAGHHPAHVLDCIPSSSCPGHYSALVPAHTCAACWIPPSTHHWVAHNPGTYTQLPSNLDTIQPMPGLHPVWHLHTAAYWPICPGERLRVTPYCHRRCHADAHCILPATAGGGHT